MQQRARGSQGKSTRTRADGAGDATDHRYQVGSGLTLREEGGVIGMEPAETSS